MDFSDFKKFESLSEIFVHCCKKTGRQVVEHAYYLSCRDFPGILFLKENTSQTSGQNSEQTPDFVPQILSLLSKLISRCSTELSYGKGHSLTKNSTYTAVCRI